MHEALRIWLEGGGWTAPALVLARMLGAVAIGGAFGPLGAPLRVRVWLAVALTALVTPTVVAEGQSVVTTASWADLVSALAVEVALGIALGFVPWAIVAGAQLAGQVVRQATGASLAETATGDGLLGPSPGGSSSAPLPRLLGLFALAVFLLVGGHRLLTQSLLESFRAAPPGAGAVSRELVDALVATVQSGFSLAFRIAAPACAAALIASLAIAMLGRVLPQLGAWILGAGASAVLGLAAVALSLGAIAWSLGDEIEPLIDRVTSALANDSAPPPRLDREN